MNRLGGIGAKYGYSGQTLVEYCICGSAVLLVCVAGLTLFSGNLANLFDIVKQDMSKNVQLTAQAKQPPAGSDLGGGTAMGAENGGEALPGHIEQAMNDALGSADGSMNETINVSGANGGTAEAYVATIMNQAKQSLSSGNISQDEYDVIMRMANKGHDIAQIQGLLEGAFKQSDGNSAAYAGANLNFNGQSYTPDQLNAVMENNISDFSLLKAKASTLNGVLYDSSLLNTIDGSGAQIINNGYSSVQQNQSADSFIQYQNAGLAGGSADTHKESATVCTTGSYQDSGTNCSK